ncbi:MAG: alanine racemase [Oscillospiraceae bacterium]
MNLKIVESAIEKFKTPSYIFDLDELKERVKFLNKHVGKRASLCFAMKANPFIVKALCECVDRFEVCSPGEFCICEKEQIPMEKLVVSGVYKEESDIERMMKNYDSIGVYTAESEQQFEQLRKYSDLYGRKIKVLLRLTSGNQFGMDESEIKKIIQNRTNYSYIEITGIQYFGGTQKTSVKRLSKELHYVDDFITSLAQELGFEAKELEFGPGFPVSYFQSEKDMDEEAFLSDFSDILAEIEFDGKITLEIGRSIAADCGVYLTRVVDMKTNKDQNYCIVDGGMHQICYYSQIMAMKVPHYCILPARDEGATVNWNICGALCTTNDILIKQLPICNLKKGDVLVFKNAGAYCMTEGISLFLSRDLPTIILYSKEHGLDCARDKMQTYKLNSKA